MATNDSGDNAGLSNGAILGIVLGALAFVCIKLGRASGRIQRGAPLKAPFRPDETRQRRRDRQNDLDKFLEKLKEHEFDCCDIEVLMDAEGNEIHLGTGGFGCVILGARNGVQPVAIKQMLHTDQKAKEDFLNEIQLLKHVSLDANVLQYYGATIKDEYLWLVTEYMEGGDLRQALSADNDNQLNWWNGGKQIALDIAKGLAFLHSRNVIHRDIKSQNILLTREGRAKIADVGMAQMASEDAVTHARKARQQGTFAWAAPEILVKESRCTDKVDIYSFGVCLWEIVTSQMPRRGEIFCPSADACPATVISLIHDCMKYDPVDRPSAKEICRRLAACEPHGPDFEGIMDTAEGGGRRSTVLPSGFHGRGRGWSSQPQPLPQSEPRRNLPVFRYDSPMSTMGDDLAARRASPPAKQLELTVRQPRNGLDMADTKAATLGAAPEPMDRQAEIQVDEKVEITSASPRFYRPPCISVSHKEKLRRNALEIQPGIREIEEEDSEGDGEDEGAGAVYDTHDSLPQSNSAFSELVARYSGKFSEEETRHPSEDTNILSSMDADASHIPSLHNTINITGELSQMLESHSEAAGEEAGVPDPWVIPMESSNELYKASSQDSSHVGPLPMHVTQRLPSPEELHGSRRGSLEARTESTLTPESARTSLDELEHATMASVQVFAGSVTSSSPRVSQRELQLHLAARRCSQDTSYTSPDTEPEDNTSHHLEVPRARISSLAYGSNDGLLHGGDPSPQFPVILEGEPHARNPSSLLATNPASLSLSMSSIYRTGESIYHSMDVPDNVSEFESTGSLG